MRLLVTGGAGFIGSNFIRYWLSRHPDDEVVNIDTLTYAGNLDTLAGIDERRHRFLQGDILDAGTVRQAMEGVSTVVHFAAETHVDRSIADGQAFLMTNVLGTHTLLNEALRRDGQIVRFHHVSTDEVFGALGLDEARRFDESSPYAPRSPYAASKAAADHLVRAYYATYGLPVTITNCSNNYGPYHFPEKFIPVMIAHALDNRPLPLYGDGRHVRDWLHVEDHCRGIEAVLTRGTAGETYCLGGDAERENREVAALILDHLGRERSLLSSVSDRKGHDRRYALDCAKARGLGWAPQIPFEAGLRRTVDWFVDNESWWRPLFARAGGVLTGRA